MTVSSSAASRPKTRCCWRDHHSRQRPRKSRRRAKSAAGTGARDENGKMVPLEVKAGDRILFGKWSGTEVKIAGQDLMIMKESDILGIAG